MSSSKKLVIVESPAKAKTIGKYLGDGYEVMASVGHVRDLAHPRDLPAEMKKGPSGKFGIDLENDFAPYYVTTDRGKKTVADLKRAAKTASEILLATDEDREGEAIAWHLLEVLKPSVPVKRMVFHEITQESITEATKQTRELDVALVDAQETRRILDRLYGFEVSPVLWRRVSGAKSAGRVQSPALRLIVDRELERRSFVTASYSDIEAVVHKATGEKFTVALARLDGRRVASGRDFSEEGKLTSDAVLLQEDQAAALQTVLREPSVTPTVLSVEPKPYTRRPAAPFTTSTLQQEAGRKLRFSAQQTMSIAQGLYENGHLTYMRTDSVSLSSQAINAARVAATELYGAKSIPGEPRLYKGKSKNAQEAHEAVRPAGDRFATPQSLSSVLRSDELKLYDLIWKRTVASQMVDAKGETVTVTLEATPLPGSDFTSAWFTASGTVLTERGFLQAYQEGSDDEAEGASEDDALLPKVAVGESVTISDVLAKAHTTQPPARYTEASLVKALEEKGIGRPSTYASIISVIIDRDYVVRRGSALVPQWIAFPVTRLLHERFSDLVDYDYTAGLEEDLDSIARGETKRGEWLHRFYFGDDKTRGLKKVAEDATEEIDARELNTLEISPTINLRVGKYGPFLEVTDTETGEVRNVNLPPELAPDELTPERAQELADAPPVVDRVLGVDPATGREIVAKQGRFGPYVTEVLPVPDEPTSDEAPKKKKKVAAEKPKTASLFQSMDLDTIDAETALRLLALPREVGVDPESGEMITAQNGRYGPYLKKGTDTRSLDSEEGIFEIDLEGALARYLEPKYGGRRQASALMTFEADPVSGKPILLKDGRFGPYVTDGEINATVPRGMPIDQLDFEQAVQLIADKRAKGPAPKRAAKKKAPAKKAGAKKTTTTTVSKTGAKKTAAAKSGKPKTLTITEAAG
ncbi:MAG: DNA topoisomerase I [actinobacterium acMicro-4]|nr:MAG: DNA topoisomerase I [actinobacterium acMicro-4]